jgi:cyclin-dependent kinase 8/11
MMGMPAPTQAQTQSQVPPAHVQAQGQHLSQQSQVNFSQQSKPGSTASFGSVGGGGPVGSFSGGQGGSSRKKARIG